jgi:hypothetical protein
LVIQFAPAHAPMATFDSNKVMVGGRPVINWFLRELFTSYAEETVEGEYKLDVGFDKECDIEIEGKEYPVTGIACIATRVCRNKRKWVSWSGDALYDWHTGRFTVPPNGTIVGSAVESDLSAWPDYDGEIPELRNETAAMFFRAVLYGVQKWDPAKDSEVPDLDRL